MSLPPARSDRALQIVLTEPAAWDQLTHDDHQLLCELPAPHGPLFAWLDAHVHEHGPQPWPMLLQALAGQEQEGFAVALVARMPETIEGDPAELAGILARERDRRRDEEMRDLAARAGTDPAAYDRLRQLLEAQKALKSPPGGIM